MSVLQNIKKNFANEYIIYALTVSVFLHYAVTAAVIILAAVYLLIKENSRKQIFAHKSIYIMAAFSLLTLVVALCYKNYVGVACSLGAFLIVTVAFYMYSVITKAVYEKALWLCCVSSVFVTLIVVIEKLINLNNAGYRCVAYFFNSNYLASVMAAVVIICAYKVITRQGNMYFYYAVALFSAVSMYLCGSLFVWIEVLVGVSVLLALTRQHRLLSVFLIVVAIGCALIYCMPGLIPRLSESNITTDNRVVIWELSLSFIKTAPLLGHGFLSYMHLIQDVPDAYFTTHAHNMIIEPVLSFGIIGSLLLAVFFILFFRKLLLCKVFVRRSRINVLILSISAAVIVHGMIDMTMLWMQTALIYSVILSGLGIENKAFEQIRKKLS